MEFNIHIPATEDPALIIVVGFAAPGALNHKQERVEVGVVHHRLPHRQVRRAVEGDVLLVRVPTIVARNSWFTTRPVAEIFGMAFVEQTTPLVILVVGVGVVHHRLPHRQVRRAVARRVLVQVVEVELLVAGHIITPLVTARLLAIRLPMEG